MSTPSGQTSHTCALQALSQNAGLARQLERQDPVWEKGAAGFLEAAAAILEATAGVASSLHTHHPVSLRRQGFCIAHVKAPQYIPAECSSTRQIWAM